MSHIFFDDLEKKGSGVWARGRCLQVDEKEIRTPLAVHSPQKHEDRGCSTDSTKYAGYYHLAVLHHGWIRALHPSKKTPQNPDRAGTRENDVFRMCLERSVDSKSVHRLGFSVN